MRKTGKCKCALISVVTILIRVDNYIYRRRRGQLIKSKDLCYLDSGPSHVNSYSEGLTTETSGTTSHRTELGGNSINHTHKKIKVFPLTLLSADLTVFGDRE